MRSDEFSRHELRKSHAAFQDLTSQIQELQETMNYMSDSREFQDEESICSGKLTHVPSQPAIVPSLGGMLSRDQSLRPETWNLLGTSGNVFDRPCVLINSSSTPYQGMLHCWNRRKPQCEIVQEPWLAPENCCPSIDGGDQPQLP